MDSRQRAKQLADEYTQQGKATEWFEVLYQRAEGDEKAVPWADLTPNPNLTQWLERENHRGEGKKALVVGCGLGDDAEELARIGFEVVAFDISPTAIAWCQKRFPNSSVNYRVADLLNTNWDKEFDFVLESYTLQALPAEIRETAMKAISQSVSPTGMLLIICRGRDPEDDPGNLPPYRLTKTELNTFQKMDLKEVSFEDYMDRKEPPVRRLRILYRAKNN